MSAESDPVLSGQVWSGQVWSGQVLLVTHGSSDRRYGIAAQLLCQCLRDWFALHSFHNVVVENVVLECHELSLADQVIAQLNSARSSGIGRSVLVPLFLLPGMHVMEDIPAQVEIVRERLAIESTFMDVGVESVAYPILSVMPFLGNWPSMKLALLDHLLPESVDSVAGDRALRLGRTTQHLLLAHGSRWPGSMESLEAIAQTLQMATAYWLIEPKLEPRLEELIAGGCNVIELFPYFLFEGGISDAIDRLIQGLSQRYPQVEFVMHDVLAIRPDFVAILGQELERFVGADGPPNILDSVQP